MPNVNFDGKRKHSKPKLPTRRKQLPWHESDADLDAWTADAIEAYLREKVYIVRGVRGVRLIRQLAHAELQEALYERELAKRTLGKVKMTAADVASRTWRTAAKHCQSLLAELEQCEGVTERRRESKSDLGLDQHLTVVQFGAHRRAVPSDDMDLYPPELDD